MGPRNGPATAAGTRRNRSSAPRLTAAFAFAAGFLARNFLLLALAPAPPPKPPGAFDLADGPPSRRRTSASSSSSAARPGPRRRPPPALAGSVVLSVLLDDQGSCPDNCAFVHDFFPDWVQFRYETFRNRQGDLAPLAVENGGGGEAEAGGGEGDDDEGGSGEDADEGAGTGGTAAPLRRPPHHVGLDSAVGNRTNHVLVVARDHVVEIARWARARRERDGAASVGLFLMGDEELLRHRQLVDANLLGGFDYVVRNYYFPPNRMGEVPLRFLGNVTCGASPRPLPSPPDASGPRWGLHWAFLRPHVWHPLLTRPARSVEPPRSRERNCTFAGWAGGNRLSKDDRARVRRLAKRDYADLNCDVSLSGTFGANKFDKTKLAYLAEDLGGSKFGLNPRGVHPECHRLPEMLKMGTVPAMKRQEYMRHLFRPIPGVVEDDWVRVFEQMKRYLSDEVDSDEVDGDEVDGAEDELTKLSREGAEWMEELEACVRSDMDVVLRGAFWNQPS